MTRRGTIRAAACLLGAALAWSARAQLEEGTTVAGFRIPEYDEQGRIKSQLFGDFAKAVSEDVVEITNLRIEVFKDGAIDMRVAAPHCLYNRRENTAASPSQVRVTRNNLVITGKGFRWEAGASRFEIHEQARVILRGVSRGLATGATP